jgi:hypothetical protein
MESDDLPEFYETHSMILIPSIRNKKNYRISWVAGPPRIVNFIPRRFNKITKEIEKRISKIKSCEH